MNIDPAAVHAVAVAEEIGLVAGSLSAVVPTLPLLDAVDDVLEAASTAAAAAAVILHGYDIEGIDDVPPHVKRHAIAFYDKLIALFEESSAQFFLINRAKYYKIVRSLKRVQSGETLSSLRSLYPQIHHWNKTYAINATNPDSQILFARPKDLSTNDLLIVDTQELKRITYLERVFADLLVAHGTDHNKGRTLYSRLSELVHNVPRSICKLFTDLCPRCIECHQRNRPTAGLRPIITNGFNVRGQVDLIDFQSMPDGEFRFLLNYIDHGIKFLFSIPIVRKRASCIAVALLQIFTIIGPPMILQSDNGSEFHGAAMSSR